MLPHWAKPSLNPMPLLSKWGEGWFWDDKRKRQKTVKFADEAQQTAHPRNWVRDPSSIQDQMVLEAAKRGEEKRIMRDLKRSNI